jgi:cell division GTPase FtsZ
MEALLIGVGAAGNKAVISAIENGTMKQDDCIIINSTSKDIPKDYDGKKIILSSTDAGCGKERSIAKDMVKQAMEEGKFNFGDQLNKYVAVIICSSVEGGTGSGSTPLIAKFFKQVCNKNVHIIAFTGFEEDVRGLQNTVEFFKEIESDIVVQTISNASFMSRTGGNKPRAEQLANEDMAVRLSVILGQDFIEGKQNIDDTDIFKVSNTTGYMTVSKKTFNQNLETRDDFDKIIKNMVYQSSSIRSTDPAAIRLAVILNISPASEDAIDYTFKNLKAAYGNPFEFFLQEQWDGEKEYIAFIASGMKMPIDEIKAVHDRYIEMSNRVNKNGDEFYSSVSDLNPLAEDSQFNMIKEKKTGISIANFLSNN